MEMYCPDDIMIVYQEPLLHDANNTLDIVYHEKYDKLLNENVTCHVLNHRTRNLDFTA